MAVAFVVAWSLFSSCSVDKLVAPPIQGVLVPGTSSLADSAAIGSSALRFLKVGLGTSRPGSLAWRAERAQNSSWLGLVRVVGNAPDTLEIRLSPASLAVGTYRDTLVLSTNNSEAPPVRLPVEFTIHPCRVTTVPLDTVVSSPLDGSACVSPRTAGMFARLFEFTGTAGDSVTLELQATGFNAQLVLDTAAGPTGAPPLAQETACRGVSGDPCLTYFALPVSGHYYVEVTGATAGAAGTFVLNVAAPAVPSPPTTLQQLREDAVTTIAVGQTISNLTVVLRARVSDPDAVDTLRLEAELRPVSQAFTGTATHTSGLVASGDPATIVTLASDDSAYHWRVRAADQTGRRGPWVSFGTNGETQPDFTTSVPQRPATPGALSQIRGSDQTTPIPVGGTSPTRSIAFRATLTDPDPGDQLRLEVEVRPVGAAFTDSIMAQSLPVASGGTATATIAGLSDNTSYHWHARVVDQRDSASAWTSFGGNAEAAADFVVAVPAAQLEFTAQPTTAQAGASISPAIQVTARNSDGTTALSFQDTVTLAIGINPGGGSLSGAIKAKAVLGVATFSNVSINRSGTGYTLTGTAASLPGVSGTSAAFNITPGPAQILAFTVQPTSVTSAQAITPAVEVRARDALGNTATAFTGNVTIAIGTNPAGGALSGAPSAAAVAGVATFTNLRIDKAGTGYTLVASASGLTSGTSGTFGVTAGAAATLAFTVQPSNAAAGAAITPAVQVTARDAQGNTATGFTSPITLAIGTNPSGALLGGTTSVSATAGVAVFSGLSIDKAGTGYTLTANATNLSAATSGAFNISAASATQLVFVVQPSLVSAGATLTPAVQVRVQDALGNPVSSFTGAITLAFGTNAGGGNLSGTLSVAAVQGTATFGDLSIDKSGTGYTLTAASGTLAAATSVAFNVTHAAATKLAVTVQPTNTTAGVAIAPAVQVAARDAFDNLVTSFVDSITVTIGTNPGSGGQLSGSAKVKATGGIASFGTLSINRAAVGYTLAASATGLSGATSNAFTIMPGVATQLAFTAQPTSVVAAATITPSVRVAALDAHGNTATGFSSNITVAIGTNPGGGTLGGSTTVTPSQGVATFANLNINKSGTGYTLTAGALNVTGVTSAPFDVAPGTAAKLAFTVAPSNAPAGATISPAVQVSARDAQDNTATGFTGTITLAIASNPGGGTLSGTADVVAAAGIATFGNLSINRAGVGYTLSAAATGLTGTTSGAFTISAASATQLVFTGQPSHVQAGAAIAPAVHVTARDSLGNTATTFTGNVTVTIGNNPAGGTLLGTSTTTVAAVAGVATFSNLRLDKVGTGYSLQASAGGAGTASSGPFDVTPGAATQLAFTVQPTNATAGTSIVPSVQVTARDAHGNTATGFTANVTVAIGTNAGNPAGFLAGTKTQAAAAGVATFGGLSIDRVGSGYTLTAAATGVTGTTSSAFTITPGAATHLAFTTQPSNTAAAASIAPAIQVTARDAQGNTATTFTGDITLAIDNNPGTGTLSNGGPMPAVAGIATFPTASINKTGNGYTLTAAAPGLTGATSATFNITPGAPSQLFFTVQPVTTAAGAALTPAIQVTVRDAQGNTAQYNGNVTITIGTNPAGGTLSGTATRPASNGIATFDNLRIDRVGSGYTLTANDGGLTGATSVPFDIIPAAASQLAFTVQPSDQQAGVALAPSVRVSILDSQGNLVPTATNNVILTLAIPGGATLTGGGPVAASGGVATFSNLRVDKVGAYTLQAASGTLGGAVSTSFTILPAPASVLAFTVQPSTTVAAASIAPAVEVTARDAFGNQATSFAGQVSIAIAANPGAGVLSGTATVSAVSGIATFPTLSINRSGAGYTLAASAPNLTGSTSAPFTITPGAATQLAFTVQPTTTTAATTMTPAVRVTALDGQGNVATGFTDSVTIAIATNPSGGVLAGTTKVRAAAGDAIFQDLAINLAGSGYTLTATATGLTGTTSQPFTIAPGTATQLVFTVQPSSATAGVAISPAIQVTARDAQGNTATGFSGLVSLAIASNPGGGTLSGTASVAAASGVATFAGLSVDKSGTGYTLSAQAAGTTSPTSSTFDIAPAAASVLVFTRQPTSSNAGASITPPVQVTARDPFGNTAAGFAGAVTLAIGTNPGAGTLSGTTSVSATAGVASFPGISINAAGTGYTLTASATSLANATSAAFDVIAGAAVALVFSDQPTNAQAGASLVPAVRVTAVDNLGNVATSFTGSVTVALGANPGGGTLSGGGAVAAVAGVATFPTLSVNRTGAGYTLTAATSGFTTITSSAFNVTPGPASQLAFTVQPTGTTAGVAIAPAVQVTAHDALGNVATGFAGTVTIAIGDNPGGATLGGTSAAAAVSGVATFANLRLNRTGTAYTLTASATAVTGATSNTFAITPAPAGVLVFSTQPSRTVAGAAITPAVQVTARDSVGNVATGFTGTVTLAIADNPAGGTLSGTAAVAATAGVASFGGLSINAAGTGYTLTATATGPAAATSAPFDITPGTATVLVFTQQPSTTTAGAPITPGVQVTARDNQGNTAAGFTGTITLAIANNPSGAALSGTASLAATAGVASFPGLNINLAGTGYTLSATAVGPASATSSAFDITAGAASVLVFTQQPSNATAGVAMAPAVQVTARDAQGNIATSFTGTVTVAIGANPGGGTLSGAGAVAATAGVATFADLRINRSGAGYTLTAAAAGVPAATSAAFAITPAPAQALAFTVQPPHGVAGTALAPAVVVTAQDSLGNTATAFTGNVAMAIGANPGGSTLSGTTTVAATAGVATFANLRLNRTGASYTLVATATGPAGATSATFDIAPAPASVLAFTLEPSDATAGVVIAPAVQVTAFDSVGNIATGFTGGVGLTIGTNPGGGTLTGGGPVAAVAGVATFSGLSIEKSGAGYTLLAQATGVTAATSQGFTITPGTATALVFATQPVGTTAGATISAVQVTARDAHGNTATAFTGLVSIAIGTNPAGGILSGTTSVNATAGVATFATLSINTAGSGYTLVASSSGLPDATSDAFTIAAGAATQLFFTVEPTTTVAGRAINPGVEVTARDGLGNVATGFNAQVTIAIGSNPSGGAFRPGATLTVTAASGVATFANLRLDRVGVGYTLTASGGGAGNASSAAFDVTPAPAVRLAFTTQPVTTTAGVAIAPAVAVTAQDSLANTAPDFAGNVSISIDVNPVGGTLSGTTSAAASAGVATFTNLRITRAGAGYTLLGAAAGLIGSNSAAFTIVPAPASQLVFTTQPSTTVAASAISPAVQVTARDSLGNTATGFTGTVSAALGANPAGGTLSGTTAVAAVAGIATFADLHIDRAAAGYTLTVNAAGVTGTTSVAFTVTPGTAAQLVFAVQPTTATAGAALTPAIQVTARDAQGNTATGFTGNVTVAIATNPASGTLSGVTTVAASAGTATFAGLSINRAGAGYTLDATAQGLAGATSVAFDIAPGAAATLTFTVQPSNAVAGAAIAPAVQVTARDALGNTATAFTGTVSIAIANNPGGSTLTGTAAVSAAAGVATFADLHLDHTGVGYTLSASATGPTGATSAAFDIAPGTAAALFFTVQPSNAVAGADLTPAVVVTARDAHGNTATGFTGIVSIALGANPGAGTLSGAATVGATAGVATFGTLQINRTGSSYTLVASASALSGATSAAFDITPGAPVALTFTVQPVTTTAGAAIAPAVQVAARDNQGNIATGFNGSVTVAIANNPSGGTLSGTLTVAAANGIAAFGDLSIQVVGTGYTLDASASGLTGDTSTPFDVSPGLASMLVFTVQPSSAGAGVAISPAVQVTARDAHGNTASGFTSNVTVALGANPAAGTLSGTATVAATAGVASFASLSIDAAGTGYTLTAAAAGLTGAASAAFDIAPGAASVLVFTVQPSSATAGVAISPAVQVTARDNLGNTATAFTGGVNIAIAANPGGGALSGTASVAAVGGVATFADLRINRSGTGYTLTAAATGLGATTSAAFTITPGAAALLVFTGQPTQTTAGMVITPAVQVTALDDQGNTATAFNGTVSVAVGVNPGGGTLSGATSAVAVAGVAAFADLRLDRAATGYTLAAAASGPAGGTSAAFDIVPGVASQLSFTVQPSGATAGVPIAPAVQVTARDDQGNTATAFAGDVTLSIVANPGGGTLLGTSTVTAVSGVATFGAVRIDRTGSGYTLAATATGPAGITSSAFDITPAPPSALAFTVQPSTATAGLSIAPAVQVTARDSLGNAATAFAGNVTLAIANNPTSGTLSGATSVAAAAGIATFADLSINASGVGYTLAANATGLTGATSSAFTIVPGAASVLVFTQQPSDAIAGVAIAPAVQITARDDQGNVADTFTGDITVALASNPGGGTLSGTTLVAATAGVASFSTLSIDKAGVGYALSAAAGGVGVTSSIGFAIAPAAPSSIAINAGDGQTATVNTAVAVDPSVIVRDAFANPVQGVSVTFTVTGGGGTITPASPAIIATDAQGVAALTTWTLGTDASLSNTLNAASGSLAGSPVVFTATATPGPVSAAQSTMQASPGVITASTGSSASTVTVNVRDQFNNPISGATVALSATGTANTLTQPAGTTGINGVATGSLSSTKAEAKTVSVTANGVLLAGSSAVFVVPGTVSASHSSIAADPTAILASDGSSQSTITVTARDQFDNPISGATVTLAASGSNNTLAQPATTSPNGETTGALSSTTAEDKTVTASINGVAVTQQAVVTVTPATASQLVFTQEPTSALANTPISPAIVVTIRDAFGNTVTGFVGTVTMAIEHDPSVLPPAQLTGTNPVNVVNGTATFNDLAIDKTGIDYTLRAFTGLLSVISTAFTIL